MDTYSEILLTHSEVELLHTVIPALQICCRIYLNEDLNFKDSQIKRMTEITPIEDLTEIFFNVSHRNIFSYIKFFPLTYSFPTTIYELKELIKAANQKPRVVEQLVSSTSKVSKSAAVPKKKNVTNQIKHSNVNICLFEFETVEILNDIQCIFEFSTISREPYLSRYWIVKGTKGNIIYNKVTNDRYHHEVIYSNVSFVSQNEKHQNSISARVENSPYIGVCSLKARVRSSSKIRAKDSKIYSLKARARSSLKIRAEDSLISYRREENNNLKLQEVRVIDADIGNDHKRCHDEVLISPPSNCSLTIKWISKQLILLLKVVGIYCLLLKPLGLYPWCMERGPPPCAFKISVD